MVWIKTLDYLTELKFNSPGKPRGFFPPVGYLDPSSCQSLVRGLIPGWRCGKTNRGSAELSTLWSGGHAFCDHEHIHEEHQKMRWVRGYFTAIVINFDLRFSWTVCVGFNTTCFTRGSLSWNRGRVKGHMTLVIEIDFPKVTWEIEWGYETDL